MDASKRRRRRKKEKIHVSGGTRSEKNGSTIELYEHNGTKGKDTSSQSQTFVNFTLIGIGRASPNQS